MLHPVLSLRPISLHTVCAHISCAASGEVSLELQDLEVGPGAPGCYPLRGRSLSPFTDSLKPSGFFGGGTQKEALASLFYSSLGAFPACQGGLSSRLGVLFT